MNWSRYSGILFGGLMAAPTIARAAPDLSNLTLDTQQWGFQVTAEDIVSNVQDTLSMSIVALAIMGFLVGALLFIVSGQNAEWKTLGKDFMIGAVIGVAIVMGVKGIINLVMHFIYGS